MIALGIVIGFIIGALALGWAGGIAGAFVGFIVTLAWRSRTQARERMQRAAPVPPPGAPKAMRAALSSTANDDAPRSIETMRRLTAIELRIEALERHAGIDTPRAATEAESPEPMVQSSVPPAAIAACDAASATPSRWRSLRPKRPRLPPRPSRLRARVGRNASAAASRTCPRRPRSRRRLRLRRHPRHRPPAPVNPLWAWFTGGNALTRIGVVVLFFGVAFLLRYFAEFITIPIEVKLLGVASSGGALIALGAWLARTRPGYGLSLEGAGAGILYLTTFAAFRLYDVLPAAPAFALLVAIAALTVGLAMRADSQPLAGLAIAGGFLAPFLVSTSAGSPALLFGYFVVLNAAIFALAWLRAWRALNALGFVFTFALGVFWGERYYRPEHFATVEPFLALFFVFYVTIAILYAKRGPLQASPTKGRPESGAPSGGSAQRFGGVLRRRSTRSWCSACRSSASRCRRASCTTRATALRRARCAWRPCMARCGRAVAATRARTVAPRPRILRARRHSRDGRDSVRRRSALDHRLVGPRRRCRVLDRVPAATRRRARVRLAVAGGRGARVRRKRLRSGRAPVLQRDVSRNGMIALAALATAFVADRHRDDISATNAHWCRC